MTPASRPESGVFIGCAGWSIPKESAAKFVATGSHLERYSMRFNAVEINSSFYRPHRVSTYARWAASVPDTFRFSVKIPRSITHERRLIDAKPALASLLEQVSGLGEKLGCLLVQLPPSLQFDAAVSAKFLAALRSVYGGPAVFEPRHASWFAADVDRQLTDAGIGRVAADPPAGSELASIPAGCPDSVYFRLHGSPEIYYSTYSDVYIAALSLRMQTLATHCAAWCIFDNTASGGAAENALALTETVTSSK